MFLTIFLKSKSPMLALALQLKPLMILAFFFLFFVWLKFLIFYHIRETYLL